MMGRAAFNALVFPYRFTADKAIEYCIFKRADPADFWQGISGGGEDDEGRKIFDF